MAQKPFFMDKGIKVGDWTFTQTTNGDLKISSSEVFTSQKPFLVDQGFKIGTMSWYETGEDFKASEDDSGLYQRPFLADAGIQVGDWVITQNADYDVSISVGGSVLSGLYSSTAISSGTVPAFSGYSISGLDTSGVDGTVTVPSIPSVMTFSADGTYIFVQDGQNVYRAELSTAWDITSVGSFTQVFTFGTGGTELSEGCHWWSSDGTYFFQIVQYTAGDTELVIHKNAVGTAWDMTTYSGGSYYEELRISYASIQAVLDANGVTGVQPQDFTRIKFSSGGTRIILLSSSGHIIEFSTSDAWSASRSGSISYSYFSGDYVEFLDFAFNGTGTKCWVTARDANGNVYILEYYMASPWDFNTMTFNTQWDLGSFAGLCLGIWWEYNKIYFGGTDLNGTGVNFITSIGLSTEGAVVVPDPTYAIQLKDTSGNVITGSVNEGTSYDIIVTTTNVPDGTVLYIKTYFSKPVGYTDPYFNDWYTYGNSYTVTINNNTGTLRITFTADNTTETGQERIKLLVSTENNYTALTGAATGWFIINDTSQDPVYIDPTPYSWSISTSWDLAGGTSATPNSTQIADPTNSSLIGQIVEGQTGTFTVTTDAPDGTQVYIGYAVYYTGTYGYADDPYYQDFSSAPLGTYTVSNGQITGAYTPVQDNVDENGEFRQLFVKNNSSWTPGEYVYLTRGQWLHINDGEPSYGYSVKIVGSVPVSTLENDTTFSGSFTQWYGGMDFTNGSIVGSSSNVWTDFQARVASSVDMWDGWNTETTLMTSASISIKATISVVNGYPEILFESHNPDQVIQWGSSSTLTHIGFNNVFSNTGIGSGSVIKVQPAANNYTINN